MKIGFFAPGCPAAASLDELTRGEGRWSLNWMHILAEEGHEICQISHRPYEGDRLDWYFNTPWASPDACFDRRVSYSNHAHLRYGPLLDDSWFKAVEAEHPRITCLKDNPDHDPGSIVFGYKSNYFDSIPEWIRTGRAYNIGLMPIPFSDSMIKFPLTSSFTRPGISWLSKEVFHRGQFERNSPVPEIGLVFLRALDRFAQKVDFTFHFIMTGEEKIPQEAKDILGRLNTNYVNLTPFTPLLKLLSSVKINLGVAGMASSTIDSIFVNSVPLGHVNGFMTDTIRSELPEGVLPCTLDTTEEEVFNMLERLWFDKKFYRGVSDCYQEEFSVHRKENAIRLFESFVESTL